MESVNRRHQTYEQWQQAMLDETSRFIEWGLAHPEEVDWIPAHPVGRGAFPERVKSLFWALFANNSRGPE